MSEKIYVLDNHRRLRDDETIRAGDLYREIHSGRIKPVKHSIGYTPNRNSGYLLNYTFWRRRHVKRKLAPVVSVKAPAVTANKNTPKFPEVKFLYPSSRRWGAPEERHVKVITKDDKYIVGLEVQSEGGHQFKRFSVDRVIGEIKLVKF